MDTLTHLNTPEGIEKRRHTFIIWSNAGHASQTKKLAEDPEYFKSVSNRMKATSLAAWEAQYDVMIIGTKKACIAAALPATCLKRNETFLKIGHQQGKKNSQFGSCWVSNRVKSIKIRKEELCEYLLNGYSQGRKMKSL